MKANYSGCISELRRHVYSFTDESSKGCIAALKAMAKYPIPVNATLPEAHDLLLFVCAHPPNETVLKLAEKELNRIALSLQKAASKQKKALENTGLPFTDISTKFSHDFCCWLNENNGIHLSIESFQDATIELIDAIKLTLPSVEREYTSTGAGYDELLTELKIKESQRLSFILDQFSELNDRPLIKDHIFDSLGLYVMVQAKNKQFSRTYNRAPIEAIAFQKEIVKKFDHITLMNAKLPHAFIRDEKVVSEYAEVIRNSMALTARETDPATFMDESSLRIYPLGQGLDIALYGMKAERQLPTESYVGYTLFKNGFPAAYGGGWVFGRRSLFGINIYESFRGGESGLMMCQILRAYRQVFGVDYFEVEPYQYGADNPDGIKSGAFWFYYRFGFRPLDKDLNKLAGIESEKIKSKPGYRTPEKTLLRFTESNIALNFGKTIPPSVSDYTVKVTSLISKKFGGNRREAIESITSSFLSKTEMTIPEDHTSWKVLEEVAMLAEVMGLKDVEKLKEMSTLIPAKVKNVYLYQERLNLLV